LILGFWGKYFENGLGGFWGKFSQKKESVYLILEMNQSAISTYFLKGKVKYTGYGSSLIGQPIVHTFLDSGKVF
jgi:hypothetical protein